MSAIFGSLSRIAGASARAPSIERLADALAVYGTDGLNFYHSGPISLGQRMRFSTPESKLEILPQTDSTGRYTLTAAARIDNRDDLIAALKLPPPISPSEAITDSDLILAGYAAWGERCPERLLGDFAFAVWDAREQSLFLARDHFGVQPLAYAESDGLFVFASAIEALRDFAQETRGAGQGGINESELAAYIGSAARDPAQTFFSGIVRLPAAHCLTVSSSTGAKLRRYWTLDPNRAAPPDSDAGYARQLKKLFTEAVRCRMRSTGDVGCMLSGGLDSSAITVVANSLLPEHGSGKLPTFSAVVSGPGAAQEREYIDAVLDSGAYRPTFLAADQIDPAADLAQMIAAVEEPAIPGNLYINWRLYEAAAREGVGVLLEGFDGDNAVGHGTGVFRELASRGRWIALAWQLRGYTRNLSHETLSHAFWSWFKRYGLSKWKANLPLFALIRSLRARRAAASQSAPTTLPRSRAIEEAEQRLNPRLRHFLAGRASLSDVPNHETERRQHIASLTEYDPGSVLEILVKIGLAQGVEPRFPFMDVRLVEFCVSLPAEQKMRGGITRLVMRNAMQGILPDAVRKRRGKGEYDRVFVDALVRGRMPRSAADAIKQTSDIVNAARLESIASRLEASEISTEQALDLWHVFCIYLWRQKLLRKGNFEANQERAV